MRTKSTDRYQVTCEIPHDSGMHEWVVEVGGDQIYIESAHEGAVERLIKDANIFTNNESAWALTDEIRTKWAKTYFCEDSTRRDGESPDEEYVCLNSEDIACAIEAIAKRGETHFNTPMDKIHSELRHYAKDFRVIDTLCIGVLEMELREAIDREHRLMRSMARWIKTHDIYGHMAKELLDECKEVLNDDGEFLFGKESERNGRANND